MAQKVAKPLSIGGASGSDSALSQMAEREQKLKEEQQRKEDKEEAKRLLQAEKERKDLERRKEAEKEEKLLMEELANSKDVDNREHLNLVFIGHVDAGKSTIGGQILYLSGQVDQRVIEKYEREAKDKNRDSWYMAYIMDTSEEEERKEKPWRLAKRALRQKRKDTRCWNAPGHKITANMIGARKPTWAFWSSPPEKVNSKPDLRKGTNERSTRNWQKPWGSQNWSWL